VEDRFPVLTIVLIWHLEHALESKPADCKGREVAATVNPN
jgi:hypothetical protein